MADPNDTQEVAAATPELPPGLAPVGGSASTRMFTEPFSGDAAPSELPPGLEASRPTLKQRIEEASTGALQGIARDTPVVAGAMTGLRLGMPLAAAATPAIGPFAATIPLVTTALGAGAGYLFGQELDRWFPAVSREDLVPYREGGKTFGSSIGAAPAAFALPVMTGNRVAKFISAFGETARRSPGTFMATETLTATGMGIAGGSAESYFPGQTGVRLGAELGTGILMPSRLLLTGVDAATQGIQALRSGAAGRATRMEDKAANILADILEQNREDPVALARALRAQLPAGITPTSAQKTASPTLMDLETSLGKHHVQFGGQTARQGREALDAYELLIENLQRLGNPEALRIAAQLRQNKFQAMIDGRLSMADADSAAKIARITRDTPDARRQIGQIVKTDTELALREARDIESELWTAAVNNMTQPKSVTNRVTTTIGFDTLDRPVKRSWNETRLVTPKIKPSSTVQAFLDRASNIGDAIYDDAVPGVVRKIMESFGVDQAAVQTYKFGRNTEEFVNSGNVPSRYKPDGKDVPLSELVNYRSNLLKMAREAAGKGDVNNAEFYGRLADGMLDDLNTVKNPLFDQARSYSQALNDVFTRTFAKTASITGDVTKAGAERVPAEILVMRAFGNNADVTIQRMEQVEDAVKFLRTQYDDATAKFGKNSEYAKYLKPMAELADQRVVSIQDAQNRVLRLLAGDAIETVYDQSKGAYVQKLNTAKLTRFAQQFAPTLEKLGIMGDLRNATHAQNLLLQVKKQNNVMENTLREQTAFAKVLSSENPTQVLGDVLNSNFPVKNFTNIVQLARAGGPDALNGLKSSVLDYAYTKAGGMSGRFSISAYKDALFEPIARNQPSLINILRSSGGMSLTEVKNIMRLVQPMEKVEKALRNGIPIDDVIQGADAVTDLALRVVGSQIGTAAAPGGPGSLIAASAGSRAVRQIFDALPNATVRQILENASKDPDMMALLLERGRTQRQQVSIYNRLLDKLGAMGVSVGKTAVTPALNYISPEEPRPSQLPPEFNSRGPTPAGMERFYYNADSIRQNRGLQQAPYTPEGRAARQLRMLPRDERILPPAPGTRGVPGLTNQPPAAPRPPGGGQQGSAAPSGPNARAMMQSLFPFDTISAMASQGQPPT